MGAMTTLGPSIAILASGVIVNFASWRALLWVFAALSVVFFALGTFFIRNVSKT